MSKQTLNNGESGSTIRGKINSNFTENYNNIISTQGVENLRTLHFPGNSTNVLNAINQIIELNDGRLLAVTSQFGSTFVDFTVFHITGSYSLDGGRTFGTPFQIEGIEGSEQANAIPSVWKQSNGNLVMLFWRQLAGSDPVPTSICKKTSSDGGATWSATSTVYTVGTYSAPHGGRIFQANDGVLYYPFNVWTGGAGGSPTNYDYSSQVGNYKGALLKSTDDGATWSHVSLDIVADNTAIFEPGLFQFQDAANGTVGRATFYYRSRGGFVGMAYSDDNFVTWTTGTASSLPGSNHDTHMVYIAEYDVIIGIIPHLTPWEGRKCDVLVSYDRGITWYQKLNIFTLGSTFYGAAAMPFAYKGKLMIPYFNSNSTQTLDDEYTLSAPIVGLVGINQNAILNGATQQLVGNTRIISGGGLMFDDLLLGKTSRRIVNLLNINKVGGESIAEIGNDDNNNSTSTLNFFKTKGGVALTGAENGYPVGNIRWNNILQMRGVWNNNGFADLFFEADTGGGMTTYTKFLANGQWMFGNGNSFVPIHTYSCANFSQGSANTSVVISNIDNNSNYNEIRFVKTRGINNYAITQGDVVASLEFGDGIGSAIKAVANGDANGGFRANDIVFFGTNASGVQAERIRFTGVGDLKLQNAGQGIYIKEGTNACMGLATLSSGSVVVSTTKVTANSRIFLTQQSIAGVSVATAVAISARTAGTSFTISSANVLDTSTIAWEIKEPA